MSYIFRIFLRFSQNCMSNFVSRHSNLVPSNIATPKVLAHVPSGQRSGSAQRQTSGAVFPLGTVERPKFDERPKLQKNSMINIFEYSANRYEIQENSCVFTLQNHFLDKNLEFVLGFRDTNSVGAGNSFIQPSYSGGTFGTVQTGQSWKQMIHIDISK